MQRLGAAQYSGERLDRDPHDVVQRLLHSQRYTSGLRVKTHLHGPLRLSAEAIAHRSGPDAARCAVLRDLFKEVVVSVEEKRNAWYEALKIEAGPNAPFDVFDSVSEGKREFLQRRRAGLANVITAHRNRVVPGNMGRAEFESIDDQLHRGANRINPLLLRYVLFENIVLKRAGDLLPICALLLSNHQIHGEEDGCRRINCLGNRHLFERNSVNQSLPRWPVACMPLV